MTALFLAFVLAAPPVAPASLDGTAAFERVKKLEGSWKTDGKDGPVLFVTIRVIGNGASVMETVTGSDRTAVTQVNMYSMEGTELVLTNYGAGGTSRLKLSSAGEPLKFEGSKDGRVSGLALVVKDSKLRQEWQVREGGRDAKKSIDLLREYVDTLK